MNRKPSLAGIFITPLVIARVMLITISAAALFIEPNSAHQNGNAYFALLIALGVY